MTRRVGGRSDRGSAVRLRPHPLVIFLGLMGVVLIPLGIVGVLEYGPEGLVFVLGGAVGLRSASRIVEISPDGVRMRSWFRTTRIPSSDPSIVIEIDTISRALFGSRLELRVVRVGHGGMPGTRIWLANTLQWGSIHLSGYAPAELGALRDQVEGILHSGTT